MQCLHVLVFAYENKTSVDETVTSRYAPASQSQPSVSQAVIQALPARPASVYCSSGNRTIYAHRCNDNLSLAE